MISVKEGKLPATDIKQRTFDCPSCGVGLMFCSTPLHVCRHCRNSLINLVTLRVNFIYRAAYHFETIDLKGQSIKK